MFACELRALSVTSTWPAQHHLGFGPGAHRVPVWNYEPKSGPEPSTRRLHEPCLLSPSDDITPALTGHVDGRSDSDIIPVAQRTFSLERGWLV